MTYIEYDSHVDLDGAMITKDLDCPAYVDFLAWRQIPGNVPLQPPLPTFEERKDALLVAVDAHMNEAARSKGYDNIINASLRAALPASRFHVEGVAFGTWMDAVYAKCYDVLAQVTAGAMAEPTREQLIALLPVLTLPDSKGA